MLFSDTEESRTKRKMMTLTASAPYTLFNQDYLQGFPGGAVVENLPANAGDTGSSPGLGRFHMPRSN